MNNIEIPDVFTSVLSIYEQNFTHEDGEGGGNDEDAEVNEPPRAESHHTNSNTVVSSSFPQVVQVTPTPIAIIPRETSNPGFNYPGYQPTANSYFPGSAMRASNTNIGAYVQPFPMSANSGRGVSPPPPPSSFVNNSAVHKVYYQPFQNQESHVSNVPIIIAQPGRQQIIPVSQPSPTVFGQPPPSYYSSLPPQVHPPASYPQPASFMIRPPQPQPVYNNISQQNIMMPVNSNNPMYLPQDSRKNMG
jgi:hypothetical protein